MKRTLPLYGLALGLALFATGNARAAIAWQYDWTPSSGSIISDNGKASIGVTNQANVLAVGNSDVVAAYLSSNSKAPNDPALADKFTHQNYSLSLILKDTASGLTKNFEFTGFIDGALTLNSSNTMNTFNSPTFYKDVKIGNNLYTVSVGSYTNPGPGGGFTGSFGAHVDVRPGSGGPPNAPEPSSMILGCLGMSFAGLAAWRKRRQGGEAVAV